MRNGIISYSAFVMATSLTFARAEVETATSNLLDKVAPSDKSLTCVVNLVGDAINYDPLRWAQSPFITDLSIFIDTTANPEGVYNVIESRAKSINPDILIGRYLSGGRAQSSFKQFPPEAIRINDLPTGSMRTGTDRVNLDDMETARAFATLIVDRFRQHPRPILYLDNIIHPSALSGWYSWEKSCRLLRSVRSEIHKDNAILIANVAVASWAMSDKDIDSLIDSVDGVSFEIPFHPLARKSTKNTARQIEVYRRLLDSRKVVILIAVPNPSLKTDAEKDNEARLIAGLAMMVRRPGDRLYVAWPFFRTREDWSGWPAVLGTPKGDFQINELILRRDFMNVGLTLDLPNIHVFITR